MTVLPYPIDGSRSFILECGQHGAGGGTELKLQEEVACRKSLVAGQRGEEWD